MLKTTIKSSVPINGKALESQSTETKPRSLPAEQHTISPKEKKINGIVYTPAKLANYVAKKTIRYYLEDHLHKNNCKQDKAIRNWRILDPACGNGELLVAIWRQLTEAFSKYSNGPNILRTIRPDEILCGVDTDHKATQITKLRIEALNCTPTNKNTHSKVLNTNALFPFNQKEAMKGWKWIFRRFDAPQGFDILIANPPWGADVTSYKDKLSRKQFSLYQGQFDTSDLFLELALSIVKPEGYLAFIIPDSLFNLERTSLRRLLLTTTEVRFIGRFGEKFFNKVNRACAVIICKKSQRNRNTKTECLRLTPYIRKNIVEEDMSFEEAEHLLGHSIPQERFQKNRGYRFDIDITVEDEKTIQNFHKLRSTFQDHLQSCRGVELSKYGVIYKCDNCGLWLPLPKSQKPKCSHCGNMLYIEPDNAICLVSKEKKTNYQSFLVGESICRYSINPRLWIAIDKPGIKYKSKSTYKSPKMLVRKTGVGISAALDYSNAYTNQVVYIFRPRDDIKYTLPLEFFLGIINSRAMYYFHVKTHGETEWRSHPYVTQAQILELPLPSLEILERNKSQIVHSIVNILRPFARNNQEISKEADAKVEQLVAELYGLKKSDYKLIYATLDSVEELLPIRVLKKIRIDDIFPE